MDLESHRLKVCESLYFQESPVCNQLFVVLIVYSMRLRELVSCITSTWATYGHPK